MTGNFFFLLLVSTWGPLLVYTSHLFVLALVPQGVALRHHQHLRRHLHQHHRRRLKDHHHQRRHRRQEDHRHHQQRQRLAPARRQRKGHVCCSPLPQQWTEGSSSSRPRLPPARPTTKKGRFINTRNEGPVASGLLPCSSSLALRADSITRITGIHRSFRCAPQRRRQTERVPALDPQVPDGLYPDRAIVRLPLLVRLEIEIAQ